MTLPTFIFTTVYVFGAYSAADLHIYPELSLPSCLMINSEHLMILQVADSLNTFMYIFQNYSFSVTNLMRWTIFAKLFFVAYLCLEYDDRIVQHAISFILTTISTLATAKAIKRSVDDNERLKKLGSIDLYVSLCLDIPN